MGNNKSTGQDNLNIRFLKFAATINSLSCTSSFFNINIFIFMETGLSHPNFSGRGQE